MGIPGTVRSLDQLFHWRCREVPQALAYAFLRDTLDPSSQFTFHELECRVDILVHALSHRTRPGDRVLLLFPPGLETVVAFWACLCAGLVPVPAPPYDPVRAKNNLPRLRAIIDDAQAELILAAGDISQAQKDLAATSSGRSTAWMNIDHVTDVGLERRPNPIGDETSLAYLQYTSGSTANPRGVMITHGNVLSQCRSIVSISHVGAESRSLCWLPYFHDYGLIHGIVAPFYAGIPAVLMSPLSFLRRPLRWLEAIDRWQITHSGAPNFAYELCVKAYLKQDHWEGRLDHWSVASCGAEPIHSQTLDRFYDTFAGHGFNRSTFKPAYGLAESTLVVSSNPKSEDPLLINVSSDGLMDHRIQLSDEHGPRSRILVGCGQPIPGTHVAIVDPVTGTECPSDRVGEIWVTGSSVGRGYWGHPELTGETFQATLESDPSRTYLRTGDLGFIKDGQIFITGRLKDLIILNGRNLYPNDIEAVIDGCYPGFRPGGCAAFSVEEGDAEQLVIVQEIERNQQTDFEQATTAIRLTIAEQLEVPAWCIVFVRTGSIPRTSSGKIQRHACRKSFLEQSLPILASHKSGVESLIAVEPAQNGSSSAPAGNDPVLCDVECKVRCVIAEQIQRQAAELDSRIPIVRFGLDSLRASFVKNRLFEEFGVDISFTQLYGTTSIHDLANHIVASRVQGTTVLLAGDSSTDTGCFPSSERKPPASMEEREPSRFPLSLSQRRLWFLEEWRSGSSLNHITLPIQLSGPLDQSALERSVQELIRRHSMLRASFLAEEDRVVHEIAATVTIPVPVIKLAKSDSGQDGDEMRRRIREEASVPFDLMKAPLLRVMVIERDAQSVLCLLIVHRLIADGWAVRLLCDDLAALYNRVRLVGGLALPPVRVQYREYVEWQERWRDQKIHDAQLSYWKRQLNSAPPLLDLPTDRPRPHIPLHQGGTRSRRISPELLGKLDVLCREEGVTKFMVMYSIFCAWLQRSSRSDDVVVGTVLANRRLAGWEQVVGYFSNTVALRAKLSASMTGIDLLKASRRIVSEAYDHQDIPFEIVLGALEYARGEYGPHMFNVMIVWEDDPLSGFALNDIAATLVLPEDLAVEIDLTLLVCNGAEGIELVMLYDRALFDGSTIDRILMQLESLLKAFLAAPQTRLRELPIMSDAEQRRILVDWNNTAVLPEYSTAIPHVIDDCMARYPDRVAAICGGQEISYRDLRRRVETLAEQIYERTGGANVRVGLCVERSIDGLIGVLAILKAGASYLPLDPGAPPYRQQLILDDAKPALVVVQRHLRLSLPCDPSILIECMDEEVGSNNIHKECGWPKIQFESIAYVIYTSGSSGRPKGVEVTHHNLLYSLSARMQHYVQPVASCLLTFPLAFDGSITSIFWTLLHSGTLIIPSEEQCRDPQQLASLIHLHQVTHIVLVPSLYDAMLNGGWESSLSSLRVVVSAGESLPVHVLHRHHELLEDAALYNEYGPTETTVWVTVYETNGTERGARVPIGKPIANAAVYLLDHDLQPVPIGVIGEIVIGGKQVSQGYLNLADLTERKFPANPYMPGTRMYRTGDLGRYREDGNIEFIGRADDQVKIRGYRIELAEIEAVLRELPGIRDAAVIMREETGLGPTLGACVLSDQPTGPGSSYLLELIQRRLPSYMVPKTIAVVDCFPRLTSGKVDRLGLEEQIRRSELSTLAVIQPRDHIEDSLLGIWREVLGRHTIDMHQSFFSLGGHSLLVTQAASRIREIFRVELPLRTFFEFPTIAGLAEAIRIAQRKAIVSTPLPPISPVSRTGVLPASFSQQRMWFVQQLSPGSTAYNLLFASRQQGPLRSSVFRQVVDLLSQRHEAFRTTFVMTNEGLTQRIAPWRRPHLVEIDLRQLPLDQRETAARRLAEEEGARPFDLEHGPLARISLVRIDTEDHLIILNLHHIVGDQWSFGILGRDFAAYYNALCQQHPLPDITLPVQYADYAVWQRRCLSDHALESQEAYWLKQLQQLPLLHLPTDYPRPSTQTFNGAYCSVEIPDALIQHLKRYSASHHTTPFMTLLACFYILLSRYTGQEDIAVGCPIANRTQMMMEPLIGTFVNTLVLRVGLQGNPTFDELVDRVKETSLDAFAHQDYPFDKLVDILDVERDPSMSPLVQVLFNMANAPIGDIQLYELDWVPFEVEPGSAQFDLSLSLELEEAKKAYLTFNTDLYSRETGERIAGHFLAILQQVLQEPTTTLADIKMLKEDERTQILTEWNGTERDYPRTACLPELFEAQAMEMPDAVAVSMDQDSLSYHSLNQQANQIARLLRRQGVACDVPVGLCLERSVDMVVCLLAILKAGGCYVPLDPEYPEDRLRFMVEDSGASIIITTSALAERFAGQSSRVFYLDREAIAISCEEVHNLPPVARPQHLAYILYTSGSTGQPKGVEIEHRSLVNFLWSMKQQLGCSPGDIMLSVTTLSFDIAGLEIYLPLILGGQVEVVSRLVAMEGKQLWRTLDRVKPAFMQATPATWRLLIESGWPGDPDLTALCGGEGLPLELARNLVQRTKCLWNMYGPTETTIWSTIDRIDASGSEITEVTIGRPIANTEIYILDAKLQPVPVGVTGEIYIGGDGLARGYHRRPDLTAERFVRHPFVLDQHARLYRTGDLARYRKDGKIVHLGRMDHQVKIRGFRIELGEIESALSRHPKISQTVVTARDDQQGLKQLVAYMVPKGGELVGADELRSYLRSMLPEYMVPAFFMLLESIPLTANNKVNIRALPLPELITHSEGTTRVGPRNGMEVQLMALWQQVLDVQEIGIHDNFFDLGGHSLKAAQLFFQMEAVFGRQLPLATLFQAPTIAELSEILTQSNWTPPWQSLVAIQPSGSATPLFMVPGVGGNVLVFAKLAKHLGGEQPVYGLQAKGLDGKEAPFTSVPEMAAHYVHEIRRMYPNGPYLIGGVCTGGLIAYEMAHQLSTQGRVATAFLIDTWHPDSYARYKNRLLAQVSMSAIVLAKTVSDVRSVLRLPIREWWPNLTRKSKVLVSLFKQSTMEHVQDSDFQVQRLTQATLLAVARYRVPPLSAKVVNVVATNRKIGGMIPDTRYRWQGLAGEGSCTVHIPAEDSGLLFVSPHVEELSRSLRDHLRSSQDGIMDEYLSVHNNRPA